MTNSRTIPRSSLGKAGPQVARLALGCMCMSGMYGAAYERESIATIHAALDFLPDGNTTPRTLFIRNGVYRELLL